MVLYSVAIRCRRHAAIFMATMRCGEVSGVDKRRQRVVCSVRMTDFAQKGNSLIAGLSKLGRFSSTASKSIFILTTRHFDAGDPLFGTSLKMLFCYFNPIIKIIKE